MENWPDVKTLPTELGEIGGIALSNGNKELIVFHRGSRKWEYKYVESHHCQFTLFDLFYTDILMIIVFVMIDMVQSMKMFLFILILVQEKQNIDGVRKCSLCRMA